MAAGLQSATYTVGTAMGLSVIGLCLQSFHPAPPVNLTDHLLLAFGQGATGAFLTTGTVIAAGCITALFLLTGRKS
jgi:hypothetical protein